MEKVDHIGEIIQKARLSKEMTQEELASKAGVSYTTLIKIERGSVKNPTIKTIQKLAIALNLSVDDILNKVSN